MLRPASRPSPLARSYKASKKLVSHKIHTNEHNYQHTYSVELVPICKFDLCAIPPKVKHVYGGVGPLVLCYRVSQSLHMVDPSTGRTFDVSADKYFRCGSGPPPLLHSAAAPE